MLPKLSRFETAIIHNIIRVMHAFFFHFNSFPYIKCVTWLRVVELKMTVENDICYLTLILFIKSHIGQELSSSVIYKFGQPSSLQAHFRD